MSESVTEMVRWRPWREAESTRERIRLIGVVVYTAARAFFQDSAPQWAAAIAYYSLISSLPLLLVAVSVISLFADASAATDQFTSLVGNFIPRGENRIREIVDQAVSTRSQIGLISFVTLLWTGTRVFDALTKSLNIIYDIETSYNFLQRLLVDFIMLLTIGLFFVLAVSSGFAFGIVWDSLDFVPAERGVVFQMVSWLLQVGFLLAAYFLIYRFVPRGNQEWRSALIGSVVATVIFLLARPLFLYYLGQFGRQDVVYGSLGIVVVLMLWVWIVSLITLFGGEVATHTRRMLIEPEPGR